MNEIIQFKNFSFTINDKVICNNVNFSLFGGDIALLVGENGAGKSTLFKIIRRENLEYVETKGEILYSLDNKSNVNILTYNKVDQIRHSITSLNQEDIGLRNYSILDMLLSMVSYTDRKKSKIKSIEMYNKYLKQSIEKNHRKNYRLFNREGYNTKFSSLSGGQKKLVNIVASLIQTELYNTNLLLLDEPLNNLDSDNKRIVSNMINDIKLKANKNIAIIIITHCHIFPSVNKKIVIKDSQMYLDTKNMRHYTCLGETNADGNYT